MCGVGRDSCTTDDCACEVGEVFIGFDFNTAAQQVKCLRFYQNSHLGYGEGYGARHHSLAIELHSWDGYNWRFQKTLSGLTPDTWHSDFAPQNTLWRLVADSAIPDGWKI